MKPNRKLQCITDLRARILTLSLAPGAALDEADLSAAYGISRTPLREIFQRLSGEGYVDLDGQRGARVSLLDLPMLQTFFRTAPMIYASVARLAAENRTEAQLTEIEAVQAEFSAAVRAAAPGKMALHNYRFHELIGEMAHNQYLMPSLRRLLIDHTRLGQTFYRPGSAPEEQAIRTACQQHDMLIGVLARGDADAAAALAERHWDLSRDRITRFVQPSPLAPPPPREQPGESNAV